VFDAIVRTGSFTQAAQLLGVTQPAGSRQVKLLEDQLQTELFRRENNRVMLTTSGSAFSAYVTDAIAQLDAAAEEVRGASDDLTLAVQPAIADSWFSPNMAELREAIAPTTLRLVIFDHEDELAGLDHDVSVRFGTSFGPRLRSKRLVVESVFPVASPTLAAQFGLDASSEVRELLDGPPLLCLDPTKRIWLTWERWFDACGHSWERPERDVLQRSYGVLVQQALGGRGVVLGWRTLLGDLVRRELLVRVGPQVESGNGYHLVWSAGLDRHDGLRRLRDWLESVLRQP